MVSSISVNTSSYIQQLMAEMMKKVSSADTDSVSGLSKDELSSIDAGSDIGGANFLKTLSENFDEIDSDANGQLSSEEISAFKPEPPPMGPPPGMMNELFSSTDSNDSNGLTIDELSAVDSSEDAGQSNFIDNLISNFDEIDINGDGELSQDEILASKPVDEQPKKVADAGEQALASNEGEDSSSLETFVNKIADFMAKQLSSAYGDDLSKLVSSLDLAI